MIVSARRQYQTLFYEFWGFHHSPIGYLEGGAPRFVDVTDELELAIELEDNNQAIIDSQDEKARKRLEHAGKKKVQRNDLCALIRQAFAIGFAALLSSCPPVPVSLSRLPIPALLSPSIPTSSCPPMPALLSFSMPALSSLLMSALSSPPMPASSS